MFKKFWNDESGQGMVEYALIIALIAIALVGALILVKDGILTKFDEVNAVLGDGAEGEGAGE